MPYPSPITYPSPLLFPGGGAGGRNLGNLVAIGDLLLNWIDAAGVHWVLEKFAGWGSPGSTAELTQRARGHGVTTSEGFLQARVMTLEGLIDAPTPEALVIASEQLAAAVRLDGFRLLVSEPGRVRHVEAQRQDDVIVTEVSPTVATFSIQVVARDPRKFGDLITASTRLPFSTGGLTFPITFPVTFTGVSGTGKVSINNTGNVEAPVWLRIEGPLPAGGHAVTHLGKGRTLTFGTALALGAGEFLTVDMDRREVLAQGQAPRSGYVTNRGWFSLDPGVNEIAFSSQNYSETANLTVTTKPSWQ